MLDSGLFVFRFSYNEDKMKVMEAGVWWIARKTHGGAPMES